MKREYIIYKLSESIKTTSHSEHELFARYNVKRGLRNEDHSGVLVGLTKIGNVVGYERMPEGGLKAIPGRLIYRGIDVESLVRGIQAEGRFGFEETVFLLLSGYLPDREELTTFCSVVHDFMPLGQKTKMNILDLEGQNVMNILARCVLEMYTFDENPDDTSRDNLMRQSIDLISKFPTIIAYAYNIMRHSNQGRSLHIRYPKDDLSIAENFLYMLKGHYTDLDARTLDLALMLHAEHGGGNNSTFTTHLVSSSGTDTYSVIAASIGSLKGPKHGGANIKVVQMFEDMKTCLKDWSDEEEVRTYLKAVLNKQAFDRAGLIYGMGHAVYSLSDPRARIFRSYVERLSIEKGFSEEFALYSMVERLAPQVISDERKIYKGVSPNVDFYSGFVYHMLGLPLELYTPIFAIARIAGWSAHRLEEISYNSKIMRPAYMSVSDRREYIPMSERTAELASKTNH